MNSHDQDTRSDNVCIIVDGHLVMQRGSAECYADNDSTAVAIGDGAIAAAYGDSTAIAKGAHSLAMAHAASLAQATGPHAEALAVGCKEYLKVCRPGPSSPSSAIAVGERTKSESHYGSSAYANGFSAKAYAEDFSQATTDRGKDGESNAVGHSTATAYGSRSTAIAHEHSHSLSHGEDSIAEARGHCVVNVNADGKVERMFNCVENSSTTPAI